MSSFVPHAPKIRIKNFSKWTKKYKAKLLSNVCEKGMVASPYKRIT